MTKPATLAVRIEPVDPMLFGDNRSARAGEDHALADQDPTPATVYGAIGGRIAAALGALGGGAEGWRRAAEPVLGPLAARLDDRPGDRAALLGYCPAGADGACWFPRPEHLRAAGRVEAPEPWDLLSPVPADADRGHGIVGSLGGLRRLEPPPGPALDEQTGRLWVDQTTLATALCGRPAPDRAAAGSTAPEDGATPAGEGTAAVRPAGGFFAAERRIGLTVSNRRNAAVEGRLFSRPYRRFRTEVAPGGGGWRSAGYRAWFRVLRAGADDAARWSGEGFFGGDRGRALLSFEPAADPLAAVRLAVEQAAEHAGGSASGFLLYLLTPAVAAAGGWPRAEGLAPLAAAVGRPLHASGWNAVARPPGPRPIRTLLAEGSVFFYPWPDGLDAAGRRGLVRRWWLGALDPGFAAAGFGRVLPGVWKEPR